MGVTAGRAAADAKPLVSCIMPTANRRRFVATAIGLFLAQDYPNKELIVLDDGDDAVADLIPREPGLRYIRAPARQTLGAKRNAACAAARGEIILHWDDDDWYAPQRIAYQVGAMLDENADLCGIDRVLFVDPRAREAWEYVYPPAAVPWVCGATLGYRKQLWHANPFPEVSVGEDTRFVATRPWRAGARVGGQPLLRGARSRGEHQPEAHAGCALAATRVRVRARARGPGVARSRAAGCTAAHGARRSYGPGGRRCRHRRRVAHDAADSRASSARLRGGCAARA